ncbi:acyl-coenzyme A diphosphatase FITM2-like [Mercenaria mercenaria]|uniref:acyl-coenzyme A diphosphatase FITM2-like n=1 Tax=Mercenaria mercenaria TaxID=6596 RepID=UPI00234E865C|nr:acyl-coenzyme A diphosphatase FITM2-like [Mercenaria mercenaria]
MASTHVRNSKKSQNKTAGKKKLPDPTHVGHFFSILTMSLCKKILHIDTAVKIGVYLCGVLIGSVFSDIFALPKSYFSDKKNIFNRMFVSFGFGWTLILLGGYIFLTSFVYTCGNMKLVVRKHLLRLAISTIWWFILTKTFSYVDSVVGVCSISNYKRKYDCLKAGRAWLGFDISGHVFLLIHILLTISEEAKSFKAWTNLELLLKEEDIGVKRNLTEQQISQARISYQSLTPYIKITVLLLTLWTIFCEFMLIISVVYRFHTLTQKVTAAFVAVGCWFITYQITLETKSAFLPDQPGQCTLNYMKIRQS